MAEQQHTEAAFYASLGRPYPLDRAAMNPMAVPGQNGGLPLDEEHPEDNEH